MKSFLKMLLASIIGGAILLFLIFILFASLASISSPELKVMDNTVLKLNLNAQIVERTQNNPFGNFDPFMGDFDNALGLNEVVASIKGAKEDPKIVGIYMSGGIPLAGTATLKEIRDALIDFKSSGKFITGYSEVISQKGLYLASVADTFYLNPEGFVEFSGLSSSVSYYKDALEKLGVKPVVLRATGNKFKSAVEPFLENEMSEANRLQLSELLNSFWDTYLSDLSANLGQSKEKLNALADTMITNGMAASQMGLIQATAYEDEVQQDLMGKTGARSFRSVEFISPSKYADGLDYNGQSSFNDNRVAVIIAQGPIQSGDGGEYVIGSDRIAAAIRKARLNDKVKAVVLRVNSGGGSALASEVIWREMDLTRQVKPVVASMGDVAASGGYYISAFADTIVAQPNTITGSIGAFGLFFTAEELLNDKLGINIETVKTNRYGDLGTPDRDVTEAEKKLLVAQVDQIYNTFKERVAEGRGMEIDYVESIGQGRIYSGVQAKEIGLVDVLGGISTSIDIAANMAGISDEYTVINYPEQGDPFQEFLEELGQNMETKLQQYYLGDWAQYADYKKQLESMQGLQMRLPYEVKID